MSITSKQSEDSEQVIIKVAGRFDFSVHQPFQAAYRDVDPEKVRFTIDLSKAEYIDSSAMGMLLILRERAGGERAYVTISGCSSEIRQILEVARFQKLFIIE